MAKTDTCPGQYCGRINTTSETGETLWGACGACPSGYRSNTLKQCLKCNDEPIVYQWMYLGFMAALPLVLHWFYILHQHKTWRRPAVIQLSCSFIETTVAAVLSLLAFEPRGSLRLKNCHVLDLSDWYTVFFNPQKEYVETIHCAQEAVYPFYSIVFLCYLFSLVLMLLLRPWVIALLLNDVRKQCNKAIYAAMYFHPIIVVVHAVMAGIIYYIFPHITAIATMTAIAVYAVHYKMKTPRQMFGSNWIQHFLIVVWHFVTLAFSIVGLACAYGNGFDVSHLAYLGLIPVPLAFLLLTERCSDPTSVENETLRNML